MKGASVEGTIHELPCNLWDGSLRLGGDLFEMIPIPLAYEGSIEINLEQDGKMRITGTTRSFGIGREGHLRRTISRQSVKYLGVLSEIAC